MRQAAATSEATMSVSWVEMKLAHTNCAIAKLMPTVSVAGRIARTPRHPSMMKTRAIGTKIASRGSMATSAVRNSDPPTASRTGRYMGHLLWKEWGGTCYLSGVWSDHIGGLTIVEEVPTVHVSRQRPDDGAIHSVDFSPDV